MVPLESLLAFVVASTLLIVIPGPSVLFVIGRSIALGRRAGLISVLGNAPGTLPAVLAGSFGVGAIIAASVMAFTIIKIAGALYLVYLGIQAIRHRARKVSTGAETPTSNVRLLWQGIIVGATNRRRLRSSSRCFPSS